MRVGLTLIGLGIVVIGVALMLPVALLLLAGGPGGTAGSVSLGIPALSGLGTIIIGCGVIAIGQSVRR